jgi:hypothetical protein
MRIRYVGAEASTETFGRTFHRSKWVGVGDMAPEAQATLARNPQFETDLAGAVDEEPRSLEPAIEEDAATAGSA